MKESRGNNKGSNAWEEENDDDGLFDSDDERIYQYQDKI